MTYHFVITLQLGPSRFSWDGTYEPQPGQSRQDVFRAILEDTRRAAASRGVNVDSGDFSTLFFSLEPNDLAAVA
jgi:hypothetical protein